MNKFEQINVGLQVSEKSVDLRIPRMLKLNQLKQVIHEALVMLRMNVSPEFDLMINGKAVALASNKTLTDYAVGDGDQILVKEVKLCQN